MKRLSVPRFARTTSGRVGLVLLGFVLIVAILGPFIAPHAIDEPIGSSGELPSAHAWLGTDFLGRDVLSRVLSGGWSVLLLATAATVLCYALGLLVGMVAGYSRNAVDSVLMRSVDVLLAFPGILILLIIVSGLGTSVGVLIVGVVLVQLPGIARVMRAATMEVSTRGFVEAAVARGERTPYILRREVLPNIAPIVLADFGVRYGYSVILMASMNYLNLGLQPPAADWGLMIAENQDIIALNPWAILGPSIPLALLTIGVNLVGDAYATTMSASSGVVRRRRRWLPAKAKAA